MKDHMKLNKSKNASRPSAADTPAAVGEPCLCTKFLKTWLAQRHHEPEDDLAAVLLISMLWVFRDTTPPEGLTGLSIHRDNLDSLGIATHEEALKGLEVLAKAGLVKPYVCEVRSIKTANSRRSRVKRREVVLVVELLWLTEHKSAEKADKNKRV
jgi:hypothetical protein